MASIRDLKKDVNYVTWELISECLAYQILHSDTEEAPVVKTIEQIVTKHNELLGLVNSPANKTDKAQAKANYAAVGKGIADMAGLVRDLYGKKA